jgi:hypothetical protein
MKGSRPHFNKQAKLSRSASHTHCVSKFNSPNKQTRFNELRLIYTGQSRKEAHMMPGSTTVQKITSYIP